jgi:outer membrane protein assembly factor BamB
MSFRNGHFLIAAFLFPWMVHGDDWPQWRGPERDGVWRESGIVESFEKDKLEVLWRAEISGGYSSPTVANGLVYVTDRTTKPNQKERIHCFDEMSGKLKWTVPYDCPYRNVSYDTGPRAAVAVDDGVAYALGTMGDLHALNALSGEVIWRKELNKEYDIRMPIWGISASPLIVDNKIILMIGGEKDACVIALDKKSGKEVWRSLSDDASYAAPILIKQSGKPVVVVWTGQHIAGLNPVNGQVYWKHPYEQRRMIISVATPVLHKDHLFLTSFFDGSMLLKLDPDKLAVEQVWEQRGADEQNTKGLHSIIATPYLKGDYIFGVDSYGELRCLDLKTGERVWEDLTATPRARWSTIHFVEHEPTGHLFLFNERGQLIIAELSPAGYKEIDRADLIEPTTGQLPQRGGVTWTHPAFANGKIFVRNDKELICADLTKD